MNYLLISLMMFVNTINFKSDQLKHSKVKEAYTEKQTYIESLLKSKNIEIQHLEIFLQAFKQEGVLEVWGKNKKDKQFQLLQSYEICRASGTLGPKRKEGDLQVPEGFYKINHFNPQSTYHLSLGINYPNKSDLVLSDKEHPGGLIYIHGKCVTIGCLPITDDKIKELYILAVEARNNGQSNIYVTIYPMKLKDKKIETIRRTSVYKESVLNLWQDLKTGYELFEKNRTPPIVEFLSNGRHTFK